MNTLSSLLNWIGNTIGANPSTLTTTSKTLVGAINEVGTDYIVEQGTSNGWTYRKWNSGTAECWGRTSISDLTTNVTLPLAFANTTYNLQVTFINNSNNATNITAITSYYTSVSIGVNTIPSGGAELFVIGMWK